METINITIKLPTEKVAEFQRFLDEHLNVLEFKVLPNTEAMYEADEAFRKLLKGKKQIKNTVEKYINDNNNKYK